MSLTQKRTPLAPTRRIALTASCVVLGFAACASALALRMDVTPVAAQTEASKKIHVNADDHKPVSQVRPVYPVEAKEARIQGAVILDVVIDKEGVPTKIDVQKGPKELHQSAKDAVSQWRWQPFLLNGNPIEVETTITVVYSLEK